MVPVSTKTLEEDFPYIDCLGLDENRTMTEDVYADIREAWEEEVMKRQSASIIDRSNIHRQTIQGGNGT